MSRSWKQFLIYRLPAVILFLGVTVEALAALLQGTPQLRHPLDYLLISMKQAEISNSGVVILGDSVTQDTANQYSLASKARLADLTTNQASGMTGSYILLRRHMKKMVHLAMSSLRRRQSFLPTRPLLQPLKST